MFIPVQVEIKNPRVALTLLEEPTVANRYKNRLIRNLIDNNAANCVDLIEQYSKRGLKMSDGQVNRAARMVLEKGPLRELIYCHGQLHDFKQFEKVRLQLLSKIVKAPFQQWMSKPTVVNQALGEFNFFWDCPWLVTEVELIFNRVLEIKKPEAYVRFLDRFDEWDKGALTTLQRSRIMHLIESEK